MNFINALFTAIFNAYFTKPPQIQLKILTKQSYYLNQFKRFSYNPDPLNNRSKYALTFSAATLLAVGAASTAFAQQNESLNYNIVNVQAEATREVSNDQMHAVLYIEKSHKQPAELASQINQLMSQAIATARKYPQVKVETGSQTTYPIYDNDSRKLKEWRGRAEVRVQSTDFQSGKSIGE